jgi:hypothetical protein
MKKIVLLILQFFALFQLLGGEIILTGTNQGTTQGLIVNPYNANFKSRHVQIIYTANEIIAAGGVAGNITALKWQVLELTSIPLTNFSIRMGLTSQEDLSTHVNTGAFTTVYTNPSFNFTQTGYSQIVFQNPFYWNGVDNIVIDICFGINSSTSNTGYLKTYNSNTPNLMRGIASNSGNLCDLATTATASGKPIMFLEMNTSSCMPAMYFRVHAVGTLSAAAIWSNAWSDVPDSYLFTVYQYPFTEVYYTKTSQNTNIGTTERVVFESLQPDTQYRVYVQSICGNDTMQLIGPIEFTTTPTLDLPFIQNFEGVWSENVLPYGLSYNFIITEKSYWNLQPNTPNKTKLMFNTTQNEGFALTRLFTPKLNIDRPVRVTFKYSFDWQKMSTGNNTDYVRVELNYTPGYSITTLHSNTYWSNTLVEDIILEKDFYPQYENTKLLFLLQLSGGIHRTVLTVDSISVRPLIQDAEIISFHLPGQDGEAIIDAENGFILVNVPPPTDLSLLVPVMTISDGATISPDPNLPQNFNYPVYYTITAEDTTIVKNWTIYVNGIQSVTDNSSQKLIDFYPNPAGDFLSIIATKPATIKIYDIKGNLVKEFYCENQTKIDISTLSTGIYNFRAFVGNTVEEYKFIKK